MKQVLSDGQLRGLARALQSAREEPADARIIANRYRLEEKLGEGGMAVVYRALDLKLRRPVAIKMLKDPERASEPLRERFRREALAIARLSHPNIVTMHDSGEEDGQRYLVLELVQGTPLNAAHRGDARWAAELVEKAARGVQHAHDLGIVHRDLKPGNILLTESGEPKVADFGLAYLGPTGASLTRSGAAVGTPLYMAPEQVRGGAITPRTDVYALGAILYELAAGRPPHAGDTPVELYRKILEEDPAPPRGLSAELEAIIGRAMEKSPGRRYAGARDLADDLGRWLAGREVLARPPSTWARWGRRLARRWSLLAVGAAGLLLTSIVAALLIPRWRREARDREAKQLELDREREANREREASLRTLGSLWSRVVLAKKDLHQEATRPERVRAELESLIAEVSEFPDQPQALYVRARAWLYLDELDRAADDLQAAIALDPAFEPGHALLGRVRLEQHAQLQLWAPTLLQEKRREEADRLLEEARGHFSRGGSGRSPDRWGLPRTREDEVAEVLVEAMEALRADPFGRSSRAILLAADEREPSEEYAFWLAIWSPPEDRMRWLDEAVRRMPHFAKALVMRAGIRWKQGDPAGAIEDYGKALEIRPRSFEALLNRGYAVMNFGKPAEAIADFTAALEIRPGAAEARINRGIAREKSGDPAGAIEDFEAVLQNHPRLAILYVNLAGAWRTLGEIDRAITAYTEALQIDPTLASAYACRGHLLRDRGDVIRARSDYERALEHDPKLASAWDGLGNTKWDRRDVPGAMADWAKAMECDPSYGYSWFNRANARYLLGEYRDAVADYSTAIERLPKLALAWLNRGIAKAKIGDAEGALRDWNRAIELDPNLSQAYFERAYLRAKKGERKEAVADYSEAVRLNPAMAEAYANRGLLKEQLGDEAGALADWRKAVEVAPPSWPLRSRVEGWIRQAEK